MCLKKWVRNCFFLLIKSIEIVWSWAAPGMKEGEEMIYYRLTSKISRRSRLQATGSGLFLPKHCSILQGIQAKFGLRVLDSLRNCLGQKRAELVHQVAHPWGQALWHLFPGLPQAESDRHMLLSLCWSEVIMLRVKTGITLPLGLAVWMKVELIWVGKIEWRWKYLLNSTVLIQRPYFYLFFLSFVLSINIYWMQWIRHGHHIAQP